MGAMTKLKLPEGSAQIFIVGGAEYRPAENGTLEIPSAYVRYMSKTILDFNKVEGYDSMTNTEIKELIIKADSYWTMNKLKDKNKNALIDILVGIDKDIEVPNFIPKEDKVEGE